MKVYVDELPKGCKLGCPYCYHEIKNTYYCGVQNEFMEFFGDDYLKRHKDCPLQSLANHTKQVRKEVVQEIRKEFGQRYVGYNWDDNIMVAKCCMTINDVLDQVEKGQKQCLKEKTK